MLRSIQPHLISMVKKCNLKHNTMKIALQNTRVFSVEPAVSSQNLEKTPQIKAIIEAADLCGIIPEDMESALQESPHLVKFAPRKWSVVLKMLLEFGFIVEDVLRMLSECPEILQMKEQKLQDNLETWQNCYFGENLLLSLLSCHPKLLIVEKLEITKRVTMLTPYFEGRKRVGKAIGIAPSIFDENWDSIFQKLEYLNKLHTDPSAIATTGVLRFDLHFIKMRHELLHRAGLFKMPTKNYKKGLDKNKKLHSIVNSSDQVFASNIAGLTLSEYEVFRDMYEAENKNDDEYSDSESDVE